MHEKVAAKGTIEMLSRRDVNEGVPFSLRGSIASHYAELKLNGKDEEAENYVNELLKSGDPDVVVGVHEGQIVIGRFSERGFFFPDW